MIYLGALKVQAGLGAEPRPECQETGVVTSQAGASDGVAGPTSALAPIALPAPAHPFVPKWLWMPF